MKNSIKVVVGTFCGLGLAFLICVLFINHARQQPQFVAEDWNSKASAILQSPELQTSSSMATAIAHTLHPTSKDAMITNIQTIKSGPNLIAHISVRWTSSLGNKYNSFVGWTFNRDQSVSLEIEGEDSIIKAGPDNRSQLEKWFRLEFFPALSSTIR